MDKSVREIGYLRKKKKVIIIYCRSVANPNEVIMIYDTSCDLKNQKEESLGNHDRNISSIFKGGKCPCVQNHCFRNPS